MLTTASRRTTAPSFGQPPPTIVVPRIQLYTYGRRAFAVIGPTVWNALSKDLRDPELSIASFGLLLKNALSALEALCDNNALYKLAFTLTLTLLIIGLRLGLGRWQNSIYCLVG